jgi:hypothetical protein
MILCISEMSSYLCETDCRWLAGAWSIGTEICETVSLVAAYQCEIAFQFLGEDQLV